MNIFINAISIHGGGAFVVLMRLLNEMSNQDQNITWHVTAEANILEQLPFKPNIVKIPFNWVNKSPLHLIYWYEIIFPRLLKQCKANLCFSHTNYLPYRKLPCPSLLLVQHAGHFSDEYNIYFEKFIRSHVKMFLWKEKTKWVHRSINRASLVTVQTQDLANRISEQVKLSKSKIKVIPHGPGFLTKLADQPKVFSSKKIWRIGYITKFGVQKNFETALKAVSLLKEKCVSFKLVLTLDENEFSLINKQLRILKIEEYVENHGNLNDPVQLTQLYDSLDIFIFTSLCESFGFTLVEAMAMGIPVIIANTASNCEITGNREFSFNPMDDKDLATKIYSLFHNEQQYNVLAEKTLLNASRFCWKKASQEMLKTINEIIHGTK